MRHSMGPPEDSSISQQAPAGGSAPAALPRIFVLIASYRDVECQWTVKDLFDQATHPERIFVGICWQSDLDEDRHCFEVPPPRPGQVRIAHFHWQESRGVCWARHQAQRLWQGEEYVFVTDAHMRFAAGWDVAMIAELAECPAPKPVVSCNPADYTPPRNLARNPLPTVRRANPFTPRGGMRFRGEGLDVAPDRPLNGAFIANGYVFARSEMLCEVPIDPYLYFDQEECTYSARLWTHGWDIFHSRHVLSYHYYNSTQPDAGRVRPLHWSDNAKWRAIDDVAQRRYDHLFGFALSTDPEVMREIDRYGMGSARTLETYRDYCGLDYRARIATDKALRAGFISDIDRYRRRPIGPAATPAATPESLPASPPDGGALSISVRPNPGGGRTYAVRREPPVRAKPATTSVDPLQPGDFLPLFTLQDHTGKWREVHLYVGKPLVICCLPLGDIGAWREVLAALPAIQKAYQRCRVFFLPVIPAAPETIAALIGVDAPPMPVWADPDLHIMRLLGPGSAKPGVVALAVVDRNLKLQELLHAQAPFADPCVEVAARLSAPETAPPTVISKPQAPVLLVGRALPQALCAQLIRYWEEHEHFAGKVGDGPQSALNYGSKRRTDCYLDGDLLPQVDATLLRTLAPEVEKVFGFRVRHRELYKIGCYDASDQGFFQAHRDNFSDALGHRRVAMSVNLNSDYAGGEVNFPEYGTQLYRADAGDAVIFPCGLMHEVRPVTEGRRLVLISFLFGTREEAFRQQQWAAQGRAPDAAAYRFQARSADPPGLPVSVSGSDRDAP